MMQRFKDSLWRGYGVLALLYMVFWWVMLFVWYVPTTSKLWGSWGESALAFVFITIGLFGMVFSGFVVWVCFER